MNKGNTDIIYFHRLSVQRIREGQQPVWVMDDHIDFLAELFERFISNGILSLDSLEKAAREVVEAISVNELMFKAVRISEDELMETHGRFHARDEFRRVLDLIAFQRSNDET